MQDEFNKTYTNALEDGEDSIADLLSGKISNKENIRL